ncbi:Gfo/Idh/MocA family oxidoreductase [Fulvivirgaceae bacterium BMA10]|uniref:Gfo/Idh/MocA family oxidoreductase n=1 Tax=Splendidivirga corallicola TaxID=3051826 RepID=A0ABT8KRN7_9BACT|nr:Gfo/Idh/MocA family oxidoreductase [Fulvivirgaceae bacterium BMA10]
MASSKLNFGVVGMGSIANHHIQSILELENCALTAVCSRNKAKLQAAKTKYDVNTFTDYREMMEHPDIDVVCICTPSGFHLEPTLAAAKRGKHVIVEKPLEISMDRAHQMITACDEANVKLACIFQNRYNADYQKLYSAVKKGGIGQPVLGNAYIKWYRDQDYYDATNWRGTLRGDGGAALINQSIHTIDLLLHVMGPVKSVMGRVKTLTHDIEGEDIGTAILDFENGALGTIEGSTAIYPGYPEKLEIYGSKGNIILEGGKISRCQLEGSSIDLGTGKIAEQTGSSDPMAINYKLHMKQIKEIVDNIINNEQPKVNGEEALKSLEVIQAIYKSSESGRQIVLAK